MGRAWVVWVALALGMACCAASSANSRLPARSVVLADLLAIQPTGGELADIDPAGERVAVEYQRRILVVDISSGRTLDLGEGTLPKWAPVGGRLAFYSSREGSLQLWTWQSGGAPIRLTDIPDGIDPDPSARFFGMISDALAYDWSPEGRRIVFYSRVSMVADTDAIRPLILTESSTPAAALQGIFAEPDLSSGVPQLADGRHVSSRSRRPGERLLHRLFVVPVEGGAATFIDDTSGASLNPHWSAGSAGIVAARLRSAVADDRIVSLADRPDLVSDIVRYPANGEPEVLVSGPTLKFGARISHDGRFLGYLTGRFMRNRRLVVVRLADRSEVEVDARAGVQSFAWLESGTLALNYGEARPELLSFDKTERKFLPSRASRSASPDCNIRSAFVRDAKLYLRNLCDPRETEIATLGPDTDNPNLRLGRVEAVHWTTRSGQRRSGWLLSPPGREGQGPLPVIVDVYPLANAPDWMSPMAGNQAWAAAGYAVFKPSPRAPHVWADDPASRGPQGWNLTEDDVVSGIDFLASRGAIDPGRVCLYGHSNGGSIVAELISRSDRYACAVIVAPALANWVRPAMLMPNGRAIFEGFSGGFAVDQDPSVYIGLSPVFRISRATTPTLIAAGDRDGDFLLDAIELYNGMRRPGTDVTLVRYPQQGHLFTGPALIDFWQRLMSFFQVHLR